ncbi:RNA-directed DNA polymerase, eukaryota, partial [Tanacetum coccineum]
KLRSCDEVIDKGDCSNEVVHKCTEILNKIHQVNNIQASEIAQKAKIKWAIEGDENVKFFHGMLNKKRNQSNIRGIMVNGTWVDDSVQVKREFFEHFRGRFDKPSVNRACIDTPFPVSLSIDPKEDMERSLNVELNKIIAKILANRLVGVLGDLVNEVQSAFVVDRQILDGPFILDEVLQWCRRKKKHALFSKVYFREALHRKIMGVNVEDGMVKNAASKLGCLVLKTPFTYLGTKVGGNMSRKQAWKEVVDKVLSRLSRWKMKLFHRDRLTILNPYYIRLKLGNGENTRFWVDNWYEGGAIKELKARSGIEEMQLNSLAEISRMTTLVPCEDRYVWTLESDGVFSVASIRKEIDGNDTRIWFGQTKNVFKRSLFQLASCIKWFLVGCRPYISLDACHLKGRFNGVLAAAIGIDGNNGLFPIAYGVLESKNGNSWTWFLESLKKAIGTPDGLVISSDMQKGLDLAIMQGFIYFEAKTTYYKFQAHTVVSHGSLPSSNSDTSIVNDERMSWISVEASVLELGLLLLSQKIASCWGELVDWEDTDQVSWSCKHLCLKTRMSIIINDRRKVILQGNAFWIRVKELDAWVPDFDEESEDETTSVEDEPNAINDQNNHEPNDEDRVSESSFVQETDCENNAHEKDINSSNGNPGKEQSAENVPISDDPFQIYGLLDKQKLCFRLAQKSKFVEHRGEENSKYFHGVINKRRSQLSIRGILVYRDWISDPAVVKREFFKHFQNQFSPSQSSRVQFDFAFPTRLTSEQVADLDNEVSYNEVKAAVWDCGINKSPGPDGFTFEFFRRYWAFIDQDVFDAVKTFFLDGLFPRGCNSSFIALIPKILDANLLVDVQSGLKINDQQNKIYEWEFLLVGSNMNRICEWDDIISKVSSRLSKWKLKTLSIGETSSMVMMGRLGKLRGLIGTKLLLPRRMEVLGDAWFSWAIGDSSQFHNRSTWRDILNACQSLKAQGIDLFQYIRKKIGNGEQSSFWNDIWLDDVAFKDQYGRLFALEIPSTERIARASTNIINHTLTQNTLEFTTTTLTSPYCKTANLGASYSWMSEDLDEFTHMSSLSSAHIDGDLALMGGSAESYFNHSLSHRELSMEYGSAHTFFETTIASDSILELGRDYDMCLTMLLAEFNNKIFSAGHKIDLHMLCRHCGAGTGTHINIGFDGPCMQENRGKLSITTDGCESQDTYYHCIYEYDLLTRIGLMDDAMVYLYLNVGCERAHSVFVVEFFFMNKKSSREQSLGVAFRGQISLLRLEVCAREERWGDLVFYLSRVISLVNGMRQTAGG